MQHAHQPKRSLFAQYKPLMIVLAVILALTAGWQLLMGEVTVMNSMRLFMGFFFLLFGLFKLIDLKEFARMYAEYDVVAKRAPWYGYLYPFLELALGVMLFGGVAPVLASAATVLLMGVSSIGVIQAVTDKQRIRCACLGAVVKLPMTTVTIIEDVGMGVMALVMLFIQLT